MNIDKTIAGLASPQEAPPDPLKGFKCLKCGGEEFTPVTKGTFRCRKCHAKHVIKKKPATASKLPGRNEPCVCGSGKKYKHCCL